MAPMDATFGALFDGAIVSLVLYGVTCCQLFVYYRSHRRRDFAFINYLVTILWVLDTFQQFLILHVIWHYLIELHAQPHSYAISVGNWSAIAEVIPTELSAIIVESFFIYRIWILTFKNKRVLVFFMPLTMCFLFSIGYVIKCFLLPAFRTAGTDAWILVMFAGSRACTDISIAIAMCYILYINYHPDFTPRTITLIRTLVNHTITTGLLTSIFAVLYLIAYLTMPLNMIYIAVYFVHSKLYIASMLAALISRKNLREIVSQDIELRSLYDA